MEEKNVTLPGVMLYTGFFSAMEKLPDDDLGRLIRALIAYTRSGTEPNFDGALDCVWGFLKDYADYDALRYQRSVERRRAAAEKRWQREKAASPEKKTPQKPLHPKGIATPTASAHEGAEWMLKYMKPPKNAESPTVF